MRFIKASFIGKAVRRFKRLALSVSGRELLDYPSWLERDVRTRSRFYPASKRPIRFSIITPVYFKSPAPFFKELADTLRAQTYREFEWVVLVQGPIPAELEQVITELEREPRFRFLRWPENRGIATAMRHCLEQASGEYALSVDADDLVTPDALWILASVIDQKNRPAIVYSDEDHLVRGVPTAPYLRPDWDPVLCFSSSYIWHIITYQRERALALGVYADPKTDWCPDWEAVLRFAHAGETPIHVPEVLYHWRSHENSSTHRPDPESGSLKSQKYLLGRVVSLQKDPGLYEIVQFPIFRGSPEWAIQRRTEHLPLIEVIKAKLEGNGGTELRDALEAVGSEWVCVMDPSLKMAESSNPEVTKIFELHPDVGLISGRISDESGKVLAGAELFAAGGVYSPLAGSHISDAGPFAMALKPHSVSALNPAFFFARTAVLKKLMEAIPFEINPPLLGAWLGAVARDQGVRIGFSPLVQAVVPVGQSIQGTSPRPEGLQAFARAHGSKLPDHRWLSVWSGFDQRRGVRIRTSE